MADKIYLSSQKRLKRRLDEGYKLASEKHLKQTPHPYYPENGRMVTGELVYVVKEEKKEKEVKEVSNGKS